MSAWTFVNIVAMAGNAWFAVKGATGVPALVSLFFALFMAFSLGCDYARWRGL